jgi:hypothetical protein
MPSRERWPRGNLGAIQERRKSLFSEIYIEFFQSHWTAHIRRPTEAKTEATRQDTFDKAVEKLKERVENVQVSP